MKKKYKTAITQKNSTTPKNFLFGKKNYIYMFIGLGLIALGLILMTGADANTRPDGVFDRNYWNDGIFSFRRIRLAPILITLGFIVEIYALMLNPNPNNNKQI